jgi:hypothetical protein
VKASDSQRKRWDDLGRILAFKHPAILVAITKLVDVVLASEPWSAA